MVTTLTGGGAMVCRFLTETGNTHHSWSGWSRGGVQNCHSIQRGWTFCLSLSTTDIFTVPRGLCLDLLLDEATPMRRLNNSQLEALFQV